MIPHKERPLYRCTICNDRLLRQFRQHEISWFCPSCRQEIPAFKPIVSANKRASKSDNLEAISDVQTALN
ncbi:hypothetical protein S7335_1423 [Synechococcus sp. PCC 7335]|nr:hypothetical protein S7335_1423 [Synechococcus sp. PCC 7335]